MQTTSREPAVSFEGVSKRYRFREGTTLKEVLPAILRRDGSANSFYALKDVSFRLERGESLGIIGRNGSGKSTILKLIAGVSVPTSGTVRINGSVSPLIELGAGFHPDLTGRENVFLNGAILGMTRKTLAERWREIVAFAELEDFMDTPVKHYSSGMYVRLGFSLAVHSEPDILVIDEALAVGDFAFQQKCFERIRDFQKSGASIVLVSHALDSIREFCSRAIEVNKGIVVREGDANEVCDHYARGSAPEVLSGLVGESVTLARP